MDPQAYIALIEAGISAVAQVIGYIRGQKVLSDDQKAAEVAKLLVANDALYTSLKQGPAVPPPPAA